MQEGSQTIDAALAGDASSMFVGKRSAKQSLWQTKESDPQAVSHIMQHYQVAEIMARILAGRQMPYAEIGDFLQPRLRSLLPDPFHLKDMENAALRVVEAITQKEKVAVFCDYDVDGATCGSVLLRFLRQLGVEVIAYVPDRIEEGYGPNTKALLSLKEQGASLCITVDCGIVSFEPIAVATDAGLDMVVVDHHLGTEKLPKALAVVNPNRFDENSPYGYLAGVGVTFMLVVAIAKLLRQDPKFKGQLPDLMELLDVVALGTVCDVVPLVGINRAFVSQGLKIMSRRNTIGITALAEAAGVDSDFAAYHLGFVLGPRINAGGRVGEADLGVQLLTTSDEAFAAECAKKLNHYNAERKAIETLVQEEAIAQVEAFENTDETPLLFVKGKAWHPGVIGIVASRLKDSYHKATAVLTIEHGVAKASARSISGLDFGAAIVDANAAGLLLAGGGHAMAAGFSVAEDKIEALQDFIIEHFKQQQAQSGASLVRTETVDAVITAAAVNLELAEALEQFEPYGVGNPTPQFVLANVQISYAKIVGEKHIRCTIKDISAVGKGGSVAAIAFNAVGSALEPLLLNQQPSNGSQPLYILGKIKINEWSGRRTAQVIVEDVM